MIVVCLASWFQFPKRIHIKRVPYEIVCASYTAPWPTDQCLDNSKWLTLSSAMFQVTTVYETGSCGKSLNNDIWLYAEFLQYLHGSITWFLASNNLVNNILPYVVYREKHRWNAALTDFSNHCQPSPFPICSVSLLFASVTIWMGYEISLLG